LGATFILVGLVGFIPNPLVSSEGIFVTNAMHNLVHVATGGAFLAVLLVPGKIRQGIIAIGIAYAVVAVLGFMTSGEYLLGLVHINQADRFLHVLLAAAILVAGVTAREMPAVPAQLERKSSLGAVDAGSRGRY
jgi:hypothetical protein